MKTLITLLMLTGFALTVEATCYELNAHGANRSAVLSLNKICLDPSGSVELYLDSNLVHAFQTPVQYMPARWVNRPGLVEGRRQRFPASHHYSNWSETTPPFAVIEATISAEGNSAGTNHGCSADLWFDNLKERYCFVP